MKKHKNKLVQNKYTIDGKLSYKLKYSYFPTFYDVWDKWQANGNAVNFCLEDIDLHHIKHMISYVLSNKNKMISFYINESNIGIIPAKLKTKFLKELETGAKENPVILHENCKLD